MTEGDSDIRALDEATVERIAAGEVVERPASAVKELVENSLDAGADRVDVEVRAGGTEGIVVSDDGVGMSEADLRQAVRRHTTSKIRDVGDLEAGVGTLGFRGEALSAIAAVSRTTLTSRPRDGPGDAGATELRVEGGEVVDVAPAARAPGTTVAVTDLFYNVPARREFLGADRTEFRHVNRVVSRYALANPDVAVSLTHDGRETFATPGDGDRRAAVLAVYGREVAESMVAVDARPGGPVERVHGLVSDPETTRASRAYLSTFVNGRYVEAGDLREAVVAAYDGHLAADRFPFAALFVSVSPDAVDPNVHPRKLSVRFEDPEAVTDAVEGAVRDALGKAGLVRSGAPRGRSAPGETAVTPGEPGEGDAGTGTDDTDEEPEPEPEPEPDGADGTAPEPRQAAGEDRGRSTDETGWSGGETPATNTAAAGTGRDEADTGRAADGATAEGGQTDPDADHPAPPAGAGPDRAERLEGATKGGVRPAGTDATLGGDRPAGRTVETDGLPPLRVLGRLQETYIVAESPDGLVLVDQHAADERVQYERLRERAAATEGRQRLAVPVELELTAAEAEHLRAALEELRGLGFEASLRGDRTAVVAAVPTVLGEALEPAVLRDVLSEAVPGDGDPVDRAADALLADLACAPAVTAGTDLSTGSVVELLEALGDCEHPWACPHGRPTVVEIDGDELAARFERDYPGHATRVPEDDAG